MNHAYMLYQRAVSDTTGRWEAFHFTSLDNPHLSREALAEITQDMSATDYQQEVLAQFLQNQGAVFRNVDACLTALPSRPAEHRGHLIVGGIDWGKSHDFTVLSLFCCHCLREVFLDRFNTVGWDFQRQRLLAQLEMWEARYVRVETNSIGGPNLEALRVAAPSSIILTGFEMTTKSKAPLIQSLALAFEKGAAKWLTDEVGKHELLAYEFAVTESGYTKYSAPEGGFDDTVVARCLAWKAARPYVPAPLTDDEKIEQGLPENLRGDTPPVFKNPETAQWDEESWWRAREFERAKLKKKFEQRPNDPWKPSSPLDQMGFKVKWGNE
jgi:hypothetical protein